MMSEKRICPVDQMKEWARQAPQPDGLVPDGDLAAHLKAGTTVAVLLDSNGHAYHISNLALKGARLTRLDLPRTSMNRLMDAFGVADGPVWSEIRD